MNSLIKELVESGIIKGETLALDATFIKAWSRRDPAADSYGYSDPESRVGRDGKSYDLGYKAHARARVDRFFRTSGSANERRVYEVGRASVERVNSRLEFVGLECLKL